MKDLEMVQNDCKSVVKEHGKEMTRETEITTITSAESSIGSSKAKEGNEKEDDEEKHHQNNGPSSSSDLTVTGHRLHLLVFALCITLSQSTLETTIVSTSLVSITDALHGFEQRDWIVTAYLLTYTSFLIIWARFSDVFGLKTMLLLAIILFVTFSAGCGAARSITQLIVLRALQGLGGAGIAANVTVAVSRLVPRDRAPKYIAAVSSVTALSSILGPVLGGVINVRGQWRWIFWFNVPLGSVAFVMLVVLMPSKTRMGDWRALRKSLRDKFARKSLAKLDMLGAFLLLVSSALLVFALEEGGTRYSWSHPAIISTLAVSGVTFACFFAWELHLGWAQERVSNDSSSNSTGHINDNKTDKKDSTTIIPLPVFPVLLLLRDRVVAGLVLTSFLTGFPYVALTVNIPQRLQVLNNLSALLAGLSLLPLLLITSLTTPFIAFLLSRLRTPPLLILLGGSLLQLLGVSLLCTLPTSIPAQSSRSSSPPVDRVQFAHETIMGLGFGALLTALVILTQHSSVLPLSTAGVHRGVMLAAVPQLRVLAGTISLAVCATLLNNHVKVGLAEQGFTQGEIEALSRSLAVGIEALGLGGGQEGGSDETAAQSQARVRSVFAEGYRRQFVALVGFSAAAVLSVLLMAGRRMMGRYSGMEGEEGEAGEKSGEKMEEAGEVRVVQEQGRDRERASDQGES